MTQPMGTNVLNYGDNLDPPFNSNRDEPGNRSDLKGPRP